MLQKHSSLLFRHVQSRLKRRNKEKTNEREKWSWTFINTARKLFLAVLAFARRLLLFTSLLSSYTTPFSLFFETRRAGFARFTVFTSATAILRRVLYEQYTERPDFLNILAACRDAFYCRDYFQRSRERERTREPCAGRTPILWLLKRLRFPSSVSLSFRNRFWNEPAGNNRVAMVPRVFLQDFK